MKRFHVIKLKKQRTSLGKVDAEQSNVLEIRHKVKIPKPWKALKKFWTYWL